MRRHVATAIRLSNSTITRFGPSGEYRVRFKQCLQRDILQLLTAMKGGRSWSHGTLFPFIIPLLYSASRSLFRYYGEVLDPRSILSSFSAIIFSLKPPSHLTSNQFSKKALSKPNGLYCLSPLSPNPSFPPLTSSPPPIPVVLFGCS